MRGLILIAMLVALAGTSEAQTAPTSPSPSPSRPRCDKPENRQFDFWIGHWRVFATSDQSPQGESLIEPLYEGCTLRENWVDPQLKGGSLNTYVAADGKWHQLWTDSSGAWREFVGGMVGGEMVLIATHPSLRKPGAMVRERMVFTPNPDGSVRQHKMNSLDGGPWVEGYDYTYRKAP